MKGIDQGATLTGQAYGFELSGVSSRYLQAPGRDDRPVLIVRRRVLPVDELRARSAPDDVTVLRLVGGGRLVLDRQARSADYELPAPLADDDLAHPYLGAAASVMAGWAGWDALHAGAFSHGQRAIAVLGRREDGKSTLLAALAARGVAIVTDDVLVVEGGRAHVGPRCIDLRGSVDALGLPSAAVEPSRDGERFRLALPAAAGVQELGGWVSLAWGDRLELRSLRASARLDRLARAHSRAGEPRDQALLELVPLPGWELVRPRGLGLLSETSERLLALAGG
jgi:hypothetical protein